MTEIVRKYLVDIQQAIKHIEAFVGEIDSYENFKEDLKTKSAVERQLGIVGEAIVQLTKSNVILEHSTRIKGFRNRLIHAYDSIDDTIIWVIVVSHLPKLKSEVESLLETSEL